MGSRGRARRTHITTPHDKTSDYPKERLPPFVAVLKETLSEPAWRDMSHGARSLYIALKGRYNIKTHNNGRIYLPVRTAVKEIGSHHDQICRWFKELQHYGFIVQTQPAYLGVEGKGRAPRWRLTELGYMRDPPTRDFARWNGTSFAKPKPKIKPRAGKPAPGVPQEQRNDVPESYTSTKLNDPETQHRSRSADALQTRHKSILPSPRHSPSPGLVPSTKPSVTRSRHRQRLDD